MTATAASALINHNEGPLLYGDEAPAATTVGFGHERAASVEGSIDYANGKPINRLTDMGKRFDAITMDPRDIVVEAGFNPRDWSLPANIESIQDMKAQIIAAGGVLQSLWVRLGGGKDSKKAFLIDGERRLRASLELIAEGREDLVKRVPVIQKSLDVNDPLKRLILALTANEGKPLTSFESGQSYVRLLTGGYTEEEIAAKTGKSLVFVRAAVAIVNTPKEVQQMVKDGEVSQSLAIKTVKEVGTVEAVTTLKQAVQVAKADGKKTAKTVKSNRSVSKLQQIAIIMAEYEDAEESELTKGKLIGWLADIADVMGENEAAYK